MGRLSRPAPRDLGLCVVAGVMTFVAFPTAAFPSLNLWPLLWISHVPLLFLLRGKTARGAFWWGFLCGTIINTGGYYWIGHMLETFGGFPAWLAMLGTLIHGMSLGIIWAFWAWLLNRLEATTSWSIEWTAPLVMVGVEYAVPRVFPAYMGNSQFAFPLVMQIVDLFGVAAVTFLLYRVNANLYTWLLAWREGSARPVRATMITVGLLAATFVYGGVRIHQIDAQAAAAPTLKVGLVEGDVGIFQVETQKRMADHLLIQQRLSAEAEAAGAELIVWAESAYRQIQLPRQAKKFGVSTRPLVAQASDDVGATYHDRMAPIRGFSTPVLFGSTSVEPMDAPRWKGDGKYRGFNSAWLLDGDGTVAGRYDKVYLLVFGEYVPFAQTFPWIYEMIPAAGALDPGERLEVIEADLWGKGPVRLGVLICYEGLLPSFANGLAEGKPHLLVNITNDDWFGRTAERYLHLILTIPRAIEHRLPFVRSTLTGVSAVVDPVGRLVKMTEPTEPEILVWDAPLMQGGTLYQSIGDTFPILCLLLTIGLYARGRWGQSAA